MILWWDGQEWQGCIRKCEDCVRNYRRTILFLLLICLLNVLGVLLWNRGVHVYVCTTRPSGSVRDIVPDGGYQGLPHAQWSRVTSCDRCGDTSCPSWWGEASPPHPRFLNSTKTQGCFDHFWCPKKGGSNERINGTAVCSFKFYTPLSSWKLLK